jgi:hypothetical protein
MDAPTCSMLVEVLVYIQYMEHKQLHPILLKHQIIGYCSCVDYIFVICNQKKANIDESEPNLVNKEQIQNSLLKKINTSPLISWILYDST